jgi:hypothetical protein
VSQFEMRLTPNRHDERSRSIALELVEWDKALRYSRSAGYAAPDTGGMSRDAVRSFQQALRSVVQTEMVAQGDRGWLDRLLIFLEADGRAGFGMMRQWRSWKRAVTNR